MVEEADLLEQLKVCGHAVCFLEQRSLKDGCVLTFPGLFQIVKDFYLLGRGELYQVFIDLAQQMLKAPPTAVTEHGKYGCRDTHTQGLAQLFLLGFLFSLSFLHFFVFRFCLVFHSFCLSFFPLYLLLFYFSFCFLFVCFSFLLSVRFCFFPFYAVCFLVFYIFLFGF